MKKGVLWWTLWVEIIFCIQACTLSNYPSGNCMQKSEVINNITFCKDYIPDYVCVTDTQKLWPEFNINAKDSETEQVFISSIANAIKTQYDNVTSSNFLFTNNQNCYPSFKSFLCSWNFPPCYIGNDTTAPICFENCDTFQTECWGSTTICADSRFTSVVRKKLLSFNNKNKLIMHANVFV